MGRRRRSGRGASLGTPSSLLNEAPPSVDQEANWVVSGGGLVGSRPDSGPSRTVRGVARRGADAIPKSAGPAPAEQAQPDVGRARRFLHTLRLGRGRR